MAFQIEFFRHAVADPQGETLGPRLEAFSSRRAAVAFAERHRPAEADGFSLYQDGQLLRIVHWDPARGPDGPGPGATDHAPPASSR